MWLFEYKTITKVVISGISIHVLLLVAVFDTYFKSPLEHGMSPVLSTSRPPSKRVVLFVADGLRAQAILDENENRTPFLTSIRKNNGSWGISHTRVPTESRPGHVAMLAGIYEDPSAIFKGWKHNPVDFDSVINQSTNAWCIGSPDIVTIFNKDGRKHIHIHAYDAQMQDFGNKATIMLDDWVFQKTKWLLNNYKDSEEFKQSGNVFFLHLLGLDTAGHAFKPHSKKYIENIEFVDRNIESMTKLFNEVFPDRLTSFIFTADHGMTNWGSHGSGLDHETFTPFIIWGRHIKKLNERRDINQIDIAPLISTLIGINYPTNSLGKVPVDFIQTHEILKIQNMLTNILQVFKIFDVKQQKIEKSTFFYKPYKNLSGDKFDRNFTQLWYSEEKYDILFKRCETLFEEVLKGIDYFHNYFMSYVLSSVSLGLIFWILYLSTFLFVEEKLDNNVEKYSLLKAVVVVYSVLVFIMCYVQSFSYLYYIYFLFPSTMLYFLLNKLDVLLQNFNLKLTISKFIYVIFFSGCILLFIFGLHYRSCYSLMMILNSFSIFLNRNAERQIENSLKISWVIVCFILAIFPLLPLMFTKFQIVYFTLGFLLWLIFSYRLVYKELDTFKMSSCKFRNQRNLFFVQNICFTLSFINTLVITSDYFENSSVLKYISWALLLIPIICVPFSVKFFEVRMFTIFLASAPFYLMTTMSYELIFLTFYCFLLTLWMKIEKTPKLRSDVPFENFRKCLMFVSFILIGFFGTGNIASLNSFDPMWVRCFLTVFNPFLMTLLIVFKLVLPFFLTNCAFRYIKLKTGMNLTRSFCTILLISDLMVFYFMYQIKNVGSWLEIGMSLSHFIVVECFTFGILVFYSLAFLITNVEFVFFSFFRKLTIL